MDVAARVTSKGQVTVRLLEGGAGQSQDGWIGRMSSDARPSPAPLGLAPMLGATSDEHAGCR